MAVWERFRPVSPSLRANLRAPLRLALASAILFIGAVGAWMATASAGASVDLRGVVIRDQTRLPVAVATSTQLRDILVAEGDVVAEGQPLLRIADPDQLAALLDRRRQAWSLEALAVALTAELKGESELVFPEALRKAAGADPEGSEVLKGRLTAFKARRAASSDRIAALIAERDRAEAEVIASQSNSDEALKKRAAAALDYARQALAQHTATREDAARAELETVKRRLLSVSNAVADRESSLVYEIIRAPAAGRAVGIRAGLAGRFVPAGEIVLEIEPLAPRLIVEAGLAEADPDRAEAFSALLAAHPILPGHRVRLRMLDDPADTTAADTIRGRVISVARAAGAQNADAGAVAPAPDQLMVAADNPEALDVGATVAVEVRTGGDAPLAHLLAPLRRAAGIE